MSKKALILCLSFFLSFSFQAAAWDSGGPKTEIKLFSKQLKLQMAEKAFHALYQEIDFGQEARPSFRAFRKALLGFINIRKKEGGKIKDVLTLIDFKLPSSKKRLWIIDLDRRELLFHDYVAHGRNSGGLYAKAFSNKENSLSSSLGFYLTAETYMGKYGLSLRLDGLEPGFNDKARERAVVLHGADYASEEVVEAQGRLGRSYGCPAVPFENKDAIVEAISGRSVMFIDGKDTEYEEVSLLLDQLQAAEYFAGTGFSFSPSR